MHLQLGNRSGRPFPIGYRDQHTTPPQTIRPSQDSPLIGGGHRPIRDGAPSLSLQIAENPQRPASPAGDQQFLPSIAVEIVPTHARAQTAQTSRQSRLSGPVVEVFVPMHMVQGRGLVFEPGRRNRRSRHRNRSALGGFSHFVDAIALDGFDHGFPTAAPTHLEARAGIGL